MYYVRVINGIITEGPRNDIPVLTESLIGKGWLPCNYGDYRPGLDNIGTPIIYADRVEYPITAIPAEALQQQAAQAVQAQLTVAVQAHLDATARARGYDSIFTACTYEGDPNPTWSAEGTAFKAWRSAAWQHCLVVLTAVQAQTRAIPTEAELLAELPVFTA